jgi:hypothetical protein
MTKQPQVCVKKAADNANVWKADMSQVKTIKETLQIIDQQKKKNSKP